MTHTLALEPVDRPAVMITPWKETIKHWTKQGHLKEDEDIVEHFDLDIRQAGWLNGVADLDHKDIVLEETDETILVLDGNGAKLRRHKLHDSTPEHVDFTVKDRTGWEKHVKPHLLEVDRRRITFEDSPDRIAEDYRRGKKLAGQTKRFFCWHGVGPFEQIHPVCGHEYMLMGMALDPEWVKDMVMTFVNMTINHLEVLFEEEGRPDGFFFYEDMGFKGKPFMSPTMYMEIVQPGHKKLCDYAHSVGCKVIVHSCGYVEPLLAGLIEAGMDCLQAMEVKAGMDLPKLFDNFGKSIAFFGGLDARSLVDNDLAWIDKEIEKAAYVINNGGSYIVHSDHSEPPEVDYETIQYFLKRGRELGKQI